MRKYTLIHVYDVDTAKFFNFSTTDIECRKLK